LVIFLSMTRRLKISPTKAKELGSPHNSLEVVYETEGDLVFCWLFGPAITVQKAIEKQMANFPFKKWGTKIIQRILLPEGWVSIGIQRRKGRTASQGGRLFHQEEPRS
jgi:hypothetical protein